MGLADIAGVFSRFFIVGFFLPAFFGFFAFAQFNPEHWLRPEHTTDVAVIGGLALLLALVLVGVRDGVHAAFSGYRSSLVFGTSPSDAEIHGRRGRAFEGIIARPLRQRQRRRLASLRGAKEKATSAADELRISHLLWERFGNGDDGDVRPTRFGNRARVFEDYIAARYCLGRSSWPRIQALLTDREQERMVEKDTDQRFFLNSSFVALLAGMSLTAPWSVEAARGATRAWEVLAAAASFCVGSIVSWLAYCSAVEPSQDMSTLTCAAIDAHVREFYGEFGVRTPSTRADEVAVGRAITAFIEDGVAIPDRLRDAAAGARRPG